MSQPPDFSLPECSEALVKRMNASSRRKWRLLCRACCQHVYDETKTLTWILNRAALADQHDVQYPDPQHPDHDQAFAEAAWLAKQDVDAAGKAVLSAAAQAGTVRTAAEAAGAEAAAAAPQPTPASTAAALTAAAGTMEAAAAAAAASSAPEDVLLKAFTAASGAVTAAAAATTSNLEQAGLHLARVQAVTTCIELVIHVRVAAHVARVARQHADSLARSFAQVVTGMRVKFIVQATTLELPRSLLQKLHNLRTLSCRGMMVDSLAGLPAQLRLEKLDISHTCIKLARSAEQLRQLAAVGLRCLIAQSLFIGSSDADALSALAPSLQQLHLDDLRYDTRKQPLSSLAALTGLSSLSVRGQAGGPRMLPALPALTGLTHLNLSGWLRMDAYEEQQGLYQSLGQALIPLTKLQALLLSVSAGAAITSVDELKARTGAAACRSISEALEQSRPPLTALVLEHSLMAAAGAAALAHALPVFRGTLTVLNLRGGFMAAEGALALAPGLSRLGALRQLDLAGNLVGYEGMAALAPALGQLLQLRGLCLADNGLGVAGASALAAGLWRLVWLEELLLGRNQLGDEGAEALRPALASLRALRLLDLGCNQLRSTAAVPATWKAIVPSLEKFNGGRLWIKQLGGTAAGHEGYEAESYEAEPDDDVDYDDDYEPRYDYNADEGYDTDDMGLDWYQ